MVRLVVVVKNPRSCKAITSCQLRLVSFPGWVVKNATSDEIQNNVRHQQTRRRLEAWHRALAHGWSGLITYSNGSFGSGFPDHDGDVIVVVDGEVGI